MKSIITVLLSVLVLSASAQLVKNDMGTKTPIGSVTRAFSKMLELGIVVHTNGDTVAVLTYMEDVEFPKLRQSEVIVFEAKGTTLDDLYQLMTEMFSKDKGYTQGIDLGNEHYTLTLNKEFGAKLLYVIEGKTGFGFWMYQKDVNKLFGKS